MAVAHADHLLQLQENLDRDEMPPEWMWPFSKRMNEWLDQVARDRKDRYSGGRSRDDDDMQENELLAGAR